MSLNRTLGRLFAEVRREARRNPAFANRLEAALHAHVSRRRLGAAPEPELRTESTSPRACASSAVEAPAALGAINPVGVVQREGEAALAEALACADRESLVALLFEHNLDPAGEAGGLDRDSLAAHILAQARRRAERDKKLFDY